MKKKLEEFLEILINSFCAIILCVAFYNLFINVFHQNYINQEIRVSELDKNYVKYKENVNKIRDNIQKSNLRSDKNNANNMKKIYNDVRTCLGYLTKDNSVYGIKAGQLLEPYDVYKLNYNFNNELYNYCWVSGINFNQNNYGYFQELIPSYNRTIELLVDNSDYVKKELAGNSSYHFRTSSVKNMIRNDLMEQYDMILYNYRVFSDIIAEISNLLVSGEDYDKNI